MKVFTFYRTVTDRESAQIEAETVEEAWEILNDSGAPIEYEAEPADSGPWDSVTVHEPGGGSWQAREIDLPEGAAPSVEAALTVMVSANLPAAVRQALVVLEAEAEQRGDNDAHYEHQAGPAAKALRAALDGLPVSQEDALLANLYDRVSEILEDPDGSNDDLRDAVLNLMGNLQPRLARVPVSPQAVPPYDGPVQVLRFRAQAWIKDNATDVDPCGPDTWEIPLPDFLKDFPNREDWEEDPEARETMLADARVPEWAREWSGPFEVETADLGPWKD